MKVHYYVVLAKVNLHCISLYNNIIAQEVPCPCADLFSAWNTENYLGHLVLGHLIPQQWDVYLSFPF